MYKPIAIYGDHNTLCQKALAQLYSAMEMDFALQGVALPDLHLGYALPIGSAVASEDVVVPAWVGYDVGCGMCAIKTTFSKKIVDKLKYEIHESLRREMPTGTHDHRTPQMNSSSLPGRLTPLGEEVFARRNGARQAGTLGSGNHFAEICHDIKTDDVWIVLHSGSRGTGHGIATEYMKLAANSDKPLEGHYGLSIHEDLGKEYLNDMEWLLHYALDNRMRMLRQIHKVMIHYTSGDLLMDTLINKTHNHVELINGMYIHRKGATQAGFGDMGVIPGNMKSGSYIVKGKGCAESLWSSSHGAGRDMSRTKAKADLNMQVFEADMEGIAASVCQGTLDESRGAYKDIHMVIAQQMDLVEVLHYVKPLINIKDTSKRRKR